MSIILIPDEELDKVLDRDYDRGLDTFGEACSEALSEIRKGPIDKARDKDHDKVEI